MNCKEIVELISSAVDNQIDEKQKLILTEHLAVCPKCKKEYEFELTTKRLISSFYPSFEVSEELREKISYCIRRNCDVVNTQSTPKKRFTYWYLIVPVILLIIIVIISFRSRHNHPIELAENNLIKVIYKHFDEILDGDREIAVKTSDPNILQASFKRHIGIDIEIPHLQNCALIGGWVSGEFGQKLIHMLYKDEDKIIYYSQLNFNDFVNGSQLYLDADIIKKLKETGIYIHKEFECCSVVFRLCENQLCIIAAEMDTNTLLSHLKK